MICRKKVKHRHNKNEPGQEAKYMPTDEQVDTTIRKPKWGESHLTRFLADGHKNVLITYVKQRGYFEMLDNLGVLFEKLNACSTYSDSDLSSFVVRPLFGRACGNFFAAARMGLSVVEIFENVYPNEFKEINGHQRIQTIQGQYARIAPGVAPALKSSTLDKNKQGWNAQDSNLLMARYRAQKTLSVINLIS